MNTLNQWAFWTAYRITYHRYHGHRDFGNDAPNCSLCFDEVVELAEIKS